MSGRAFPVHCPACSQPWLSSPVAALSSPGGWDIHRCGHCGVGVTIPWDRATAVERATGTLYPAAERADLYASRRRELAARFRQILREAKAIAPVESTLDVGCSTGFYLDAARRSGIGAVEGVEIDTSAREWARDNLGLSVASSLAGVRGRDFDLVLMLDVLEHVASPREILSEVRHLVRPGGLVVCQSPNIDSEMARRAGAQWSWLIPPDHVLHFTPTSLQRLVESSGLEVAASYTGDFVADYVADVYPWVPGRLLYRLAAIRHLAELRPRREGRGGIIRLIARRPE